MPHVYKNIIIIWLPLKKNEAIALSAYYCAEIKYIKDKLIEENDYTVDGAAALLLDEVKSKILRAKIREEILNEKN